MSTIERTSAYGFHHGMAARKTEHVVFNCWFVCVGGGIHSLTWPAMPKAMLRKVLSVYFFSGMQPRQLWSLFGWNSGWWALKNCRILLYFFFHAFILAVLWDACLVHSTKAEECFIGNALSSSSWKPKLYKEFTSTSTCTLWVLHPVVPVKVVWKDSTSE